MGWGSYQEDNLDATEVLELHGYICLCGDRATQVRCKTIGPVENFVISNFSALCQHCCDYYNKKRPDIKVWKGPYPISWVDYKNYIDFSQEWQDKRKKVLERDKKLCVCGNRAVDVHHKTYTNVRDEPISDLVALCRDCHTAISLGTKSDTAKPNRSPPQVQGTVVKQVQGTVVKIVMRYAGSSYLTLPEWAEKVRPHLKEMGEIFPERDLKTIVIRALISLQDGGHARQISLDRSTGKWKVF